MTRDTRGSSATCYAYHTVSYCCRIGGASRFAARNDHTRVLLLAARRCFETETRNPLVLLLFVFKQNVKPLESVQQGASQQEEERGKREDARLAYS